MPEETPQEDAVVPLSAVVADLKADLVKHLDKQDVVLVSIDRRLDSKADKLDLAALGNKLDGHATRLTTLEQHRADDLSARRTRNRIWAAVGSVAGILAIIAGSLIAAFVH
jgi:hypothetical protein